MNIGVISDTHGLLRPEALRMLQGSDLIIHAGDVDAQHVLDELEHIAPVVAVRGNCDGGAWARRLPQRQLFSAEATQVYVVHDLHDLDRDPVAEGIGVVVSGHSHKPSSETRQGVLFLNPGSAGRRRFKLPTTLARLKIDGQQVSAEIIDLLRRGA